MLAVIGWAVLLLVTIMVTLTYLLYCKVGGFELRPPKGRVKKILGLLIVIFYWSLVIFTCPFVLKAA